jgi:hypothetical protein
MPVDKRTRAKAFDTFQTPRSMAEVHRDQMAPAKKDNLLQFIGNLQNLFNLLLLVKIIIFDGNLISALLASSLFCGLLMIILAKHENYAGNVNCNHKHTHLVTLW